MQNKIPYNKQNSKNSKKTNNILELFFLNTLKSIKI